MSRSVKSLCPCHSTLVTTGQLFWWMATVLSIIQLVDSLPPLGGDTDSKYAGKWIDPSQDRPQENQIPSHYRPSSSFKFKTHNFEFSYETFRNTRPGGKSDKDAINAAIEAIIKRLIDRANERGGGFSLPNPKAPPDCQSDIICNDKSYYPSKEISRIMRYFEHLQKLVPNYVSPTADRGLAGDEQNLCQSEMKKWEPSLVRMNLTAPWHWVANTDNFEQEMSVSHCSKPNVDCSMEIGTSKMNFRTICQQQHSQRLLIVFEPGYMEKHMVKPVAKFFPVPSGCCCHEERLMENLFSDRSSHDHHHNG